MRLGRDPRWDADVQRAVFWATCFGDGVDESWGRHLLGLATDRALAAWLPIELEVTAGRLREGGGREDMLRAAEMLALATRRTNGS